jgi:hypothetical protein
MTSSCLPNIIAHKVVPSCSADCEPNVFRGAYGQSHALLPVAHLGGGQCRRTNWFILSMMTPEFERLSRRFCAPTASKYKCLCRGKNSWTSSEMTPAHVLF